MRQASAIKAVSAHRHAALLRSRLRADPTDIDARLQLAWCMVAEILDELNRNRPLNASQKTHRTSSAAVTDNPLYSLNSRVRNLSHQALRHALVVTMLSQDGEKRSEAGMLVEIVIPICGCGEASSVPRGMHARLSDLQTDIWVDRPLEQAD